MRVQFNTGFVTNSSSTVHFYDKKEIENNPSAMAYIKMLGLDEVGYFGATYLSRGQGDAILWADWAVQDARDSDRADEYGMEDSIPEREGGVVAVLASDEMETLAERFNAMMRLVGIHPFDDQERH